MGIIDGYEELRAGIRYVASDHALEITFRNTHTDPTARVLERLYLERKHLAEEYVKLMPLDEVAEIYVLEQFSQYNKDIIKILAL